MNSLKVIKAEVWANIEKAWDGFKADLDIEASRRVTDAVFDQVRVPDGVTLYVMHYPVDVVSLDGFKASVEAKTWGCTPPIFVPEETIVKDLVDSIEREMKEAAKPPTMGVAYAIYWPPLRGPNIEKEVDGKLQKFQVWKFRRGIHAWSWRDEECKHPNAKNGLCPDCFAEVH